MGVLMFKNNVGSVDKNVRIAVGIVLLILVAILPKSVFIYVLGGVGIILILTAVMNFCPLYRVLGIQTNRTTDTQHK